jgi:hypothetical protein
MITRLLTATAAVVVVGVLAGCGAGSDSGTTGSSGSSGSSGNNPPAKAAPTCDLAPASMVNSALGTNVGDPSAQTLTNIVVCTYHPTSGIGTVILRIQTDRASADFDTARGQSDSAGIKTTDLPGFEDKAYTSTISAASITTNTVVALKGTVEILVSSHASFDQEKSLAHQEPGRAAGGPVRRDVALERVIAGGHRVDRDVLLPGGHVQPSATGSEGGHVVADGLYDIGDRRVDDAPDLGQPVPRLSVIERGDVTVHCRLIRHG